MDLEFLDTRSLLEVASKPDAPRTPGIHVSDLLSGIEKQLGMGYGGGDPSPTTLIRWAVGLAWEALVLRALGDNVVHGFADSLDGIECTVDGLEFDADGNTTILECKATWKSAKNNILDNWYWMSQAKSYCMVHGARRAHFYVLYVNGNYSPPEPVVKKARVTFTNQEIEENWSLLLNYKNSLNKEEG